MASFCVESPFVLAPKSKQAEQPTEAMSMRTAQSNDLIASNKQSLSSKITKF